MLETLGKKDDDEEDSSMIEAEDHASSQVLHPRSNNRVRTHGAKNLMKTVFPSVFSL